MEALPNELQVLILELSDSIPSVRLACEKWKKMIHPKFLLSPCDVTGKEYLILGNGNRVELGTILNERLRVLDIDTEGCEMGVPKNADEVRKWNKYCCGILGHIGWKIVDGVRYRIYSKLDVNGRSTKEEVLIPADRWVKYSDLF